MRRVLVLPFLLVVVVLSACSGSDDSAEGPSVSAIGGTSTAERVEPLEVIHALSDGIQLGVSFDPDREDADVSVLDTEDNSFGYFNIWVFKDGVDSQDYEVADVQVPALGETNWGEWEALDPEYLPGKGGYQVVKSYGNVVLSYAVDAKDGTGRPALPGGFMLIDSVLSEL